jgi:hypothetical protein
MDKHYTPDDFANSIVSELACRAPRKAADFAAGTGALLAAIRCRWPHTKLAATDIDGDAVVKLRGQFPGITAAQCDFLNKNSRSQARNIARARGKFALIFLNPPFSNRGGSNYPAVFRGQALKCSRALAFVITSIPYLSRNGVMIAILPSSCLTSQRDSAALEAVSKCYDLRTVRPKNEVRFKQCSVEVVVVAISRRQTARPALANSVEFINHHSSKQARPLISAEIFRGRLPMVPPPPVAEVGGVPVIHTSNLRSGSVTRSSLMVARDHTVIASGPLILLPRVGRPDIAKVCMYLSDVEIALSECVLAIRFDNIGSTKAAFAKLLAHADAVLECYVGSCAKYVTLNRLRSTLCEIGIDATVAKVRPILKPVSNVA